MKEKDIKKIKSYIFDFDGVLGDTFDTSLAFIEKQFYLSKDRSKRFLEYEMVKNRPENIFVKLLENWYYNQFFKYIQSSEDLCFTEKIEEIKLIKGPKAILSRNKTYICKYILGQNQKEFKYILGRDNTKSKVEGLNFLNKLPDFDLSSCIFFTDTVGDILEVSKVLSKDQIYGVSWGFQPRKELEMYLPSDQVIDSFVGTKF